MSERAYIPDISDKEQWLISLMVRLRVILPLVDAAWGCELEARDELKKMTDDWFEEQERIIDRS